MRLEPPAVVYVSGPMTGYENFNRGAFELARGFLMRQGFSTLVPGDGEEFDEIEQHAWRAAPSKRAFYLRRDFNMILVANAIVVLPGWTDSEGALSEVRMAQDLGLPVYDYVTMAPIEERVEAHAG